QSGSQQLWVMSAAGGVARQVTDYPTAVNNFRLLPNGRQVAVSLDVFIDCPDLATSAAQLALAQQSKASGRLHTQMFVRHWDAWADGRHAQLFVDSLVQPGQPVWVSKGVDGDIPAKPFGDADEYAFSPDG